MSKRSRGMRWLVTFLASGTAALVIAMTVSATAPQSGRNQAEQVQQQDNAAVASQGVNAERLSRWRATQSRHHVQEELVRRRKARQLQQAAEEQALGRREAERIERRMRDRIEELNARNRYDFREMVLYVEHTLYLEPDGSMVCRTYERWVPKKIRPDPGTVQAVSPAYSPWPPWYSNP